MTVAREPVKVPLENYVILKHQKIPAKAQTPSFTEETQRGRNYSFPARNMNWTAVLQK